MGEIKTFAEFVEGMPRKTKAFTIFSLNHLQSFGLAELVRIGGKQKVEDFRQKGNKVTQRIAGLDVKEYLHLTEHQKRSLQINATDLGEMLQVAQESHKNDLSIARLTTVTLPSVLITYLFAIFEVYLQDVATEVYLTDRQLLDSLSQQKTAHIQTQLQGKTLEDQVGYLFHITKFKDVFRLIIDSNLGVDMNLIWNASNTSYNQLNKAKLIRNLYVHRGGVSDSNFAKEMGDTKIAIGQLYPLKFHYLRDTAQSLLLIAAGIDLQITEKYPSLINSTS